MIGIGSVADDPKLPKVLGHECRMHCNICAALICDDTDEQIEGRVNNCDEQIKDFQQNNSRESILKLLGSGARQAVVEAKFLQLRCYHCLSLLAAENAIYFTSYKLEIYGNRRRYQSKEDDNAGRENLRHWQ